MTAPVEPREPCGDPQCDCHVPPVPAGWFRDQPPRDLRERFIESVLDRNEATTAEHAWSILEETWRVIETADALAARHHPLTREEWFAALRVAIFRAEHP